MSSLHYSELCRLCLVNERVSIPIFDGESGIQSLCLKIGTCLPIKVSPEDILPKNICNDCFYKVENQYQFWISTANAEKQLLQWFSNSNSAPTPEVVKGLASMGADQNNFKTEMDLDPSSELSKSLSQVEAVLAGETSNVPEKEDDDEEEDESEEEGSNSEESDDDGDNAADDGAKDDGDSDEAYDEELEPTTFVNVSFECDEAGPSGTQQQQRAPTAPSTSTSAPAPSGFFQDISSADENVQELSFPISKQFTCACGQEFASSRHMNALTHDPPFTSTCNVCGKHLFTSHDIEAHQTVNCKTHGRERPTSFVCDICNFTTTRKANLLKHKRLRCNKKAYKCDICAKECISRFGLKEHKVEHTDLKPYLCVTCNKTFGHKHNMLVHMRKHDPAYTPDIFQCETCGKSYSNRGAFRGHKMSHAGVKKTVICDLCGKSVSSKETLKVHRRIHTGERPFVCDVCGKCFSAPQYFKQHKRSHTGEKPHTCNECGKSFTQRSSLTVHKRYHTGQRPYECHVCCKGFITRTLLNVHEKSRHSSA